MAVYFHIEEESLKVEILSSALTHVNKEIRERFQEATCELFWFRTHSSSLKEMRKEKEMNIQNFWNKKVQ